MDPTSATVAPQRPKSSYQHLLLAALFMLCGLSFLIFLGREKSRVAGRPLDDLDVQPLLHAEQELGPASLRGKLVVLHFWGPWCPPCRVEYPEIAKLQQDYANHDRVLVISISCGATAPENLDTLRQDTQAMLDPIAPGLTVYCDPAEFSRAQVAKLLSQRGFAYPTTLLLDPEGKVIDFWQGATGPGELAQAISKELGKRGSGG